MTNHWNNSNIQTFWGDIAHDDHIVQLYENETTFLNTLEGFVGDGFIRTESVIIIATNEHLVQLENRLINQGFDIDYLRSIDQFIPIKCEEARSRFMVNDMPDEKLFNSFANDALSRAQKGGRKVRAFGEIVAGLWEEGFTAATIALEKLWHKFLHENPICLFCAYPMYIFYHQHESINQVCNLHSKIIDGHMRPSTEIHYRSRLNQ